MQEKIYECFVSAYYGVDDTPDPHELFAMLLSLEFDVNVTRNEAESLADSIARNGITICHENGQIREIIA